MIDANAFLKALNERPLDFLDVGGDFGYFDETIDSVVNEQPTVDAVEVVRIEEVKQEILQTIDTLIATFRDISNSQFANYEKCLDIPKSSNDYYGIKAESYETARALVNAAFNDLCSCGDKKGKQ